MDLRGECTGRQLIWLAGIGLILAGILCLCLSDAVVQGWWQGTLDAFGVGFIVAGVVDVLGISLLTQAIATAGQEQEENSRRARELLKPQQDAWAQRQAIYDLLSSTGNRIDWQLRDQLWKFLADQVLPEWTPPPEERRATPEPSQE